jgi:quercetin dioxygenase-like cupin family protein
MNEKEQVLIKTAEVQIRVLALEPGEAVAWHTHTEVVDHIFCLEGELTVFFQDPAEEIRLRPGQYCQVKTLRAHRVVNSSHEPGKYLLIQGIGRYDFNPLDASQT